jgi:two-component system chemotaxis sensor kinase CheA
VNNPLLEHFVAETAELLDDVDLGLLGLEQDPGDLDLINDVFRAAHTLKGSSGLFDFPELTKLAHAVEDLLEGVRSGQVDPDTQIVDALLAGFDQIRTWMDQIDTSQQLSADAAVTGGALVDQLQLLFKLDPAGSTATDHRAVPGLQQPAVDLPDWLLAVPEPVLRALATWLETTGAAIRAVRYLPDRGCFLRGEDPLQLIREVPAIEHLCIRPVQPWPGPGEREESHCWLEFVVLTRSHPRELAHVFRTVSDQISTAEIDAGGLTRLLNRGLVPAKVGEAEFDTVTELLNAQLVLLSALVAGDSWEPQVRSAAASAMLAAVLAGLDPTPGEDCLLACLAAGDPAGLMTWIRSLQSSYGSAHSPQPTRSPSVGKAPAVTTTAKPATARSLGEHRLLRVEQAKINRLMELVSELVVVKNGLPFVAVAAEMCAEPALAKRITGEYAAISRVSEELQRAVMDARMLSVSVAFARIPRLVRDLSHRLGKNIQLRQNGPDTAMDIDVIEGLVEPLTHLVRNSLDHGFESPAERRTAGKPVEATLILNAIPEVDAVVIEIVDDGRGIDPAVILQKAFERGLIDEDALRSMADEDALELVFRPGFSTAVEVSEVSGRGVGMDAVKTGIERLGGSVTLASRPGEGTTVRLRLPLTMAVTRILLLTAGGQRFGVQFVDVIEALSVPAEDVQFVAGGPVLALRQDIVPLVWLGSLLDLPVRHESHDHNVLIVHTPTGPLGLVVDHFQRDTDVVLKPFDGILCGVPGFCGTALLGDGLVLLVLDVKELNDRAAQIR